MKTHRIQSIFPEQYTAVCSNETGEITHHEGQRAKYKFCYLVVMIGGPNDERRRTVYTTENKARALQRIKELRQTHYFSAFKIKTIKTVDIQASYSPHEPEQETKQENQLNLF